MGTGGRALIASPLILLVGGGVLALVALWRRRRQPAPAPERLTAAVERAAPQGFLGEMLDALARQGFVRPGGETPLVFARGVERLGDPRFRGVVDVVELAYREQFGRVPAASDELLRAQQVIAGLRQPIESEFSSRSVD